MRRARYELKIKMTNNKLYVGNLTFNASEHDLREIFSEAGAIVTDKTTGQSRGFAFVTMADEAGAKKPARSSTIATSWGASSP